MQKITPFLWFDDDAEAAVKFYLSVFKRGKIISVNRYAEDGPAPAGTVMTVQFQLFGQEYTALNGGIVRNRAGDRPGFKFNEAISFVVHCRTRREVDYYWRKLTADGGEPSMCGWLTDKYGLSWQIVPTAAIALLSSKDRAKAARVTQALLQMRKLDLKLLQKAARARSTKD